MRRPRPRVLALALLLAAGACDAGGEPPDPGSSASTAASTSADAPGPADSSETPDGAAASAASAAVLSVPVPGYPIGLAAARDGGVWAVATQAGAVRHLSAGARPRVDRSQEAGEIPLRAADTPAGLWVSAFGEGTVRRVGPDPLAVRRVDQPEGMVTQDGRLWVVDQLSSEVAALDPATGRLLGTRDVGIGPRLVAGGSGAVYVTAFVAGEISRVATAPPSGAGSAPIGRVLTRPVCDGPQGAAEQEGTVWVACTSEGSVVGVDPATLRRTVRVPDLPAVDALRAGPDGTVLALLPDGPTLVVIDATDGRERGRVRLADAPPVFDGNVDLLVHRGRVWASSPMSDEVLVLPLRDLPRGGAS